MCRCLLRHGECQQHRCRCDDYVFFHRFLFFLVFATNVTKLHLYLPFYLFFRASILCNRLHSTFRNAYLGMARFYRHRYPCSPRRNHIGNISPSCRLYKCAFNMARGGRRHGFSARKKARKINAALTSRKHGIYKSRMPHPFFAEKSYRLPSAFFIRMLSCRRAGMKMSIEKTKARITDR